MKEGSCELWNASELNSQTSFLTTLVDINQHCCTVRRLHPCTGECLDRRIICAFSTSWCYVTCGTTRLGKALVSCPTHQLVFANSLFAHGMKTRHLNSLSSRTLKRLTIHPIASTHPPRCCLPQFCHLTFLHSHPCNVSRSSHAFWPDGYAARRPPQTSDSQRLCNSAAAAFGQQRVCKLGHDCCHILWGLSRRRGCLSKSSAAGEGDGQSSAAELPSQHLCQIRQVARTSQVYRSESQSN